MSQQQRLKRQILGFLAAQDPSVLSSIGGFYVLQRIDAAGFSI
jgi:hypothetical protein